jgi:hypothetical protein
LPSNQNLWIKPSGFFQAGRFDKYQFPEEIFLVLIDAMFFKLRILSLEIFLLGQQSHHASRVVDFYPSSFSSGASSATMLFG